MVGIHDHLHASGYGFNLSIKLCKMLLTIVNRNNRDHGSGKLDISKRWIPKGLRGNIQQSCSIMPSEKCLFTSKKEALVLKWIDTLNYA